MPWKQEPEIDKCNEVLTVIEKCNFRFLYMYYIFICCIFCNSYKECNDFFAFFAKKIVAGCNFCKLLFIKFPLHINISPGSLVKTKSLILHTIDFS